MTDKQYAWLITFLLMIFIELETIGCNVMRIREAVTR